MPAGFGFSATWSIANRDYDGGYLPTQLAPREEFLEMAKVMKEFCSGALPGKMLRSYDQAPAA